MVYDCLRCGEELKKNKKGVMTNDKTGEIITIHTCEECNQAYGLTEKGLGFLPFDSDMKPIEHECKVCGTIYHFHHQPVFIIDEPPIIGTYCKDCGLEYLRNWVRKTNPEGVNKVTHENMREIAQLHEMSEFNRISQDKKAMGKINNHPAIKNMREKIKEGGNK